MDRTWFFLGLLGLAACAEPADASTLGGDEPSPPAAATARPPPPLATSATTKEAVVAETDLRSIPGPEGGHSRVTSSSPAPDGGRFVAGVYAGVLTAGGWAVTSRGEDDVFLARLTADDEVAWLRTMGSLRSDRGPRIVLEDARVKVIAVTRGEIDCGGEPHVHYNVWPGEMFFLCVFDLDGTPLEGAVFPTGER